MSTDNEDTPLLMPLPPGLAVRPSVGDWLPATTSGGRATKLRICRVFQSTDRRWFMEVTTDDDDVAKMIRNMMKQQRIRIYKRGSKP